MLIVLSIKIQRVLKPTTLQPWLLDSLHIYRCQRVLDLSETCARERCVPIQSTQYTGFGYGGIDGSCSYNVVNGIGGCNRCHHWIWGMPGHAPFSLLPNPAAGKEETLFIYLFSQHVDHILFFIFFNVLATVQLSGVHNRIRIVYGKT